MKRKFGIWAAIVAFFAWSHAPMAAEDVVDDAAIDCLEEVDGTAGSIANRAGPADLIRRHSDVI
jgi:hypothetical protein